MRAFIVAWALALPIMWPPAGRTQQLDCRIDDIRKSSPSGEVVITDFAMTFRHFPCPTDRIDISNPVSLSSSRRLFFWFRLEGDLGYLNNPASEEQFDIAITINGHPAWTDFVGLSKINTASARLEGSLPENEGFFDWRITANRRTWGKIPGSYSLKLLQGGKAICFSGTASHCEVNFQISD